MLEEVEDWEGLAGRLSLETIPIKTNCATSTDQASCYRRLLVRTHCDSLPSGDPGKVAKTITLMLDRMKKKKQAKKMRDLIFSCKLLSSQLLAEEILLLSALVLITLLTALVPPRTSQVHVSRLQSLDWTSGLDWWTR